MNSEPAFPSSPAVGIADTLSCRPDFVEACAGALGEGRSVHTIPIEGSGPPRTMAAIATREPVGFVSYSLGPCGLAASPGWIAPLERSTVDRIVRRLRGPQVRKFGWKVPFDREELATELARLGLVERRESTRVLRLERDYERVFAGFNATIRRQVRKARGNGVVVRASRERADVHAYYALHRRLVDERGDYHIVYPRELFDKLVQVTGTVLLLAEYDGKVAAGGVFFEDADSVVYWHGAVDRDFSPLFPARVLFEEAIRRACTRGASFFNFGGSGGIESVDRFKSFWGAEVRSNWLFEWKNPVWRGLEGARALFSGSR